MTPEETKALLKILGAPKGSKLCNKCSGTRGEWLRSGRVWQPCPACHGTGFFRQDQWFTPPTVIEAARNALGYIDLDPFSCAEANGRVQAIKYYDEHDDGFERPWAGRVFVNWPGQNVRSAARLIDQLPNCDRLVAIIFNSDTSTEWYHDLLAQGPDLCLLDHRIKFYRPGGILPGGGDRPNAIMGWNCPNFAYEFSGLGRTYREVDPVPARGTDLLDV